MLRAVLDVNILISSYIAPLGVSRWIIEQWQNDAFTVICSDGILSEFDSKMFLPRIRRRYTIRPAGVDVFKRLLTAQSEWVAVDSAEVMPVTRDSEDNYVLACALKARADYLVTGDKAHLLPLKAYESVEIVTPTHFREILQRQGVS